MFSGFLLFLHVNTIPVFQKKGGGGRFFLFAISSHGGGAGIESPELNLLR